MQATERLAAGTRWQDATGLVFTTADGTGNSPVGPGDIGGRNDMVPYSWLRTGNIVGWAAVRVDIGNNSFGSRFVVDGQYLLTTTHVIATAAARYARNGPAFIEQAEGRTDGFALPADHAGLQERRRFLAQIGIAEFFGQVGFHFRVPDKSCRSTSIVGEALRQTADTADYGWDKDRCPRPYSDRIDSHCLWN
jgi:hypothetical protein